ncbi:MAG: tRNA pseudouridine(38-40) synthase TruA [Bacteroidota bacterium]
MQRYAFEIQYKGTNYFGWQRQPRQISVQEKIEDCLKKLYGKEIAIVGCGRTDTGVHAHRSFFHTDLEDKFKTAVLLFKMNRMLPPDISVVAIHPVSADFHARFHAISRTYRYFVHNQKDPFREGLSLHLPQQPDVEAMNKACGYLIGKQDFTSFSKLHTDVKTNICQVMSAAWKRTADGNLYFEITADRFLRNMVRAIAGTLLEVGTGKIQAEEIEKIISKMDRSEAKLSVPAHALYLWEIIYEEI